MSPEKDSAEVIPLTRQKCPNCGKRAQVEYKPFCSKRCADLDLGNWLNGSYAIATEEESNLEEEES